MAEVLRQLDVQFDLAEDGAQAVHKWRNSEHDIIFMDCSMPVMDGLQATRIIRNEEDGTKRSRIPIVALTAHLEGGNKSSSWKDAGMDLRITKPFTMSQITDAIEKLTPASRRTSPPQVTAASTKPQDQSLPGNEPGEKSNVAELPVLDEMVLSGLLNIGNGKTSFVTKMISLFTQNTGPTLDRIEIAATGHDRTQLADAVHAMKSMAANMGALRLVAACAVVEEKARNNESIDTGAALKRISEELKAASAALEQHLPAA
jgi:two-component system sensor histidine kinase BarA